MTLLSSELVSITVFMSSEATIRCEAIQCHALEIIQLEFDLKVFKTEA